MSADDEFPCEDERCAIYLHEQEVPPFMCIHFHNNAEAIKYWGKVARGEIDVDMVIDDYRERLDFSKATSMNKHFDIDQCEWVGPTETIEVRADHEIVKEFTVYPHESDSLYPGFEEAKAHAHWYAVGYADGQRTQASQR